MINNSFAIETAETIYAKAYGALYKGNKSEAVRLLEKGQKYYVLTIHRVFNVKE